MATRTSMLNAFTPLSEVGDQGPRADYRAHPTRKWIHVTGTGGTQRRFVIDHLSRHLSRVLRAMTNDK